MILDVIFRGWILKKHRYRTPFGECDLLFQKENYLLMIEVKSLSRVDDSFLVNRLHFKQRQRLLNIYTFIQTKTDRPVLSAVALVDEDGKILWQKLHS